MSDTYIGRMNQAYDHYTRILSSAYKRYRVDDPDFAHINDVDAWVKINRDAVYGHAIQKRRHMVAGPDWQMLPATELKNDALVAALMDDLLRNYIENFAEVRYNLSEAPFRGSSYAFMEGSREEFRAVINTEDGPVLDVPRNWFVVKRCPHVDRFRFRQVRDEDGPQGQVRTKWQFWSVGREIWDDLTADQARLFIRHRYNNTESSLGYGTPLIAALYIYWWMKTEVNAKGLFGLDRWANGILQIAVDTLRDGKTGAVNQDVFNAYFNIFDKMRSEHFFISDKNDEVRMTDGPSTGYQMVTDFRHYLDNAGVQLILTSQLPTGGGAEGGSYARAQEEAEQMEQTIQFDRNLMSEALTRHLVKFIWDQNQPQIRAMLAAMDMPVDARMPRLRIINQKMEDPMQEAQIAATLLGAGIPLKKSEVYEKTGYTQPEEGSDDVIEPASAQPQPFIPFSAAGAGSIDPGFYRGWPGRDNINGNGNGTNH